MIGNRCCALETGCQVQHTIVQTYMLYIAYILYILYIPYILYILYIPYIASVPTAPIVLKYVHVYIHDAQIHTSRAITHTAQL